MTWAVGRFVGSLLSSRAGLVLLVAGAVYGWHLNEVRRAGVDATEACVSQVELDAAEAELAEFRRKAEVTAAAQADFQTRLSEAEAEAARVTLELEEFAYETEINPDGRVDSDLLDRLRAQ
jgi:hypothetical protein